MQIRRLSASNFKNMPDFEFKNLDRNTKLLGQPGSLDAHVIYVLGFLYDVSKRGLEAAIIMREGVAHRRSENVSISIALSNKNNYLEYDLTFVERKNHPPLVWREEARNNIRVVFSRPDDEDKDDPPRLTHVYLSQTVRNKGIRNLVKFLDSLQFVDLSMPFWAVKFNKKPVFPSIKEKIVQ